MAVTTARADLKTSLTSGRGKLSTGSRTHKGNRRTQGKRGQVEQGEEGTSGTEEHRGIKGTRRTTGRKNG